MRPAACSTTTARVVLGAVLCALCLGGCGDRLGLPQEPDDSGVPIGEIAYVVQYRWSNLPAITDVVLASGILFAIEDQTRVRAYLSDKAEPVVNAGFSFPDTVIVDDEHLQQPIQLAVGSGSTLWVAFQLPDLRILEFALGSPPRPTGQWVAGNRIGALGGMAVDTNPDSGYVYLSDAQGNSIAKYAPSAVGGRRVVVLSTAGRGDTFVMQPRGLFFFNDSLLVADAMNNRIQVIHAHEPLSGRGEVLDVSGEPLGLRAPTDVWRDRAGLFYVAESGRVTQVTTLGLIKEVVTELDPEAATSPSSVVANNTQVWVPDPDRKTLTVYQINTVAENLP